MKVSDPICGNCGNRLSKHMREHYGDELRIYCYQNTSGDVFTDEPSDTHIMQMLVDRMPDTYEALVADWKRENGYAA